MGWLFTQGLRRKELIEDRTKGWVADKVGLEYLKEHGANLTPEDKPEDFQMEAVCLKHCYRGGIRSGSLWKVMEMTFSRKSNNEILHQERFIALDLLKYQSHYGFGYKDLTEECGPNVISCPLSYLDMVPDPGCFATEWRAKVRENHANKRNVLSPVM